MKYLLLLILFTSCSNKAKVVWYNPDYCFEDVRPIHFIDRHNVNYYIVDSCHLWNYESKPIRIDKLKKL